MSKRLKVSLGVLVLAGAGAAVFLATRDADATNGGITTVTIEKGTIVDKALAVGQIVPDQEIQVKSQISGRVKEALVEVG
ncbi:MAG TPA: efflux RND transporter periplasmic adaptor subunit, partial [Thermoanaerobaculia bacterium]|nr:efflux RND transporter periplasmic adaptor subunit [Thermoanaerobaculia bacterium]